MKDLPYEIIVMLGLFCSWLGWVGSIYNKPWVIAPILNVVEACRFEPVVPLTLQSPTSGALETKSLVSTPCRLQERAPSQFE